MSRYVNLEHENSLNHRSHIAYFHTMGLIGKNKHKTTKKLKTTYVCSMPMNWLGLLGGICSWFGIDWIENVWELVL